jgi:ATP-dependent helicase IRC3
MSAKWRKGLATPSQKDFIRKRWKVPDAEHDAVDDRTARLERMTKGEAANILTRLKHGAKVRARATLD